MLKRLYSIRTMNLQKTAFIRYITSAKKPVFRNEHEYPIEDLVHPLIYNVPNSKKCEILKIPMTYHSQRHFSKFVSQLLDE